MKSKQSWSEWWYGKPAVAPPNPPNLSTTEIIENGMDTIDSLHLKRNQLVKKSYDAEQEAKRIRKTNRPRALILMKQKQEYDRQAEVFSGMIMNMERTTQTLDAAAVAADVARTMQAASAQMRDQLSQVGVADIDAVADDLDDSMISVQEISTALSRPFGMDSGMVDDDELLAQMDEWSDDAENVKLPDAPKVKVEQPAKVKTGIKQ